MESVLKYRSRHRLRAVINKRDMIVSVLGVLGQQYMGRAAILDAGTDTKLRCKELCGNKDIA